MKKLFCDACGKDTHDSGHGSWAIDLHFWHDSKHIDLCSDCGRKAARLLGFAYDAGNILSIAQGEYATGEVDIRTIVQRPDAPLAGALGQEKR